MYSHKTKKIKLNKKLFASTMLWSLQDGDMVSINKIIAAYLRTLNQDDAKRLVDLFGEKRVLSILTKLEPHTHPDDYKEALEQIEYASHPVRYRHKHPFKTMDQVINNPKQRDIDILLRSRKKSEILEYAVQNDIKNTKLFYLKQLLRTAV